MKAPELKRQTPHAGESVCIELAPSPRVADKCFVNQEVLTPQENQIGESDATLALDRIEGECEAHRVDDAGSNARAVDSTVGLSIYIL
jgi:hypothetical protein